MKIPQPFLGEVFILNKDLSYQMENVTGAMRYKEAVDWEWDGVTYHIYYIFNNRKYEKWTDVWLDFLKVGEKDHVYNTKSNIKKLDAMIDYLIGVRDKLNNREYYFIDGFMRVLRFNKDLSPKQVKTLCDIYNRHK